jgi:radical SAM-linked protein
VSSPGRTMRPAVSRIRLFFAKGPALRYIGHLDLARAWERALRRADLPVAWTQGFTPRIRLTFAAPLSLGTVSDREIAEVFFTDRVDVDVVMAKLGAQLPLGCKLLSVTSVPVTGSSLASQVRWASYEVTLWRARNEPAVDQAETCSAGEGIDVIGGSRWSRRVPDDASIPVVGTSHAPRTEGHNEAMSVTEALGHAPDAGVPLGGQNRDVGSVFIADPSRTVGVEAVDEAPLRPAAEWLPLEREDPGPPDRGEVGERLREFLHASSVMIRRTRDGRSSPVEARGAVEYAQLLPEGEEVAWVGAEPGEPRSDWEFTEPRETESIRLAPRIALVVRHDASGAGRPEDVASALGYEARWVNRRAIGLDGERHPYDDQVRRRGILATERG